MRDETAGPEPQKPPDVDRTAPEQEDPWAPLPLRRRLRKRRPTRPVSPAGADDAEDDERAGE
jgi:hypothetical protein